MAYDVMQVCMNGHMITDNLKKHPSHSQEFCKLCGEKTITLCQYCKTAIRGRYYESIPVKIIPAFCHQCGHKYSWTERGIKNQSLLKERIKKASEVNPFNSIDLICYKFHLVARQLRERYNNRPVLDIDDEYDVQYLLNALLKIYFDDVRKEEWTPSYAGSSARMDFLLKKERVVIEVKKTRPGLGAKEIGNQLIQDIERYQVHPDCKTLYCFVYDPEGRVSNPVGLEMDLCREGEDFVVKVLISPK